MRPLPADSSRVLVSHAAEGELPESVAELLAERSGGNPFFLEEALRDLVERGALSAGTAAGSSPSASTSWRSRPPCRGRSRRASTASTAPTREVALARRGDRAHLRAAAPRAVVPSATSSAGAHRAPAARPDRREAATPGPRVPLPPRPRPGGRLRGPRRLEAAQAAQARRRGARGDLPGGARGGLRAPGAPLQEADEPEKAVEYLLKAGDAARAVYADQRGARALPRGARLPRAHRRRAPRAGHPLQDGARLPPRLRLREGRGDVRRGVQCRVGEDPRLPTDRAARDRLGPARRALARRGLLDRGRVLRRAPLPRPAHGRLRAERRAGDGRQLPRLRGRAHVPLPHQGGRPLERRRAAHRRRLRVRLAADARARDPHGVPDGGRRDRGGARRPDARGAPPRAAQLLPLHPLLGLGLPVAAPQVRVARRRVGHAGEPRRQRPVRARRVRRRPRLLRANPHWTAPAATSARSTSPSTARGRG